MKQEKFWNAISDLKIKIINFYVLSNLQVILHLIKTRGRLLSITFWSPHISLTHLKLFYGKKKKKTFSQTLSLESLSVYRELLAWIVLLFIWAFLLLIDDACAFSIWQISLWFLRVRPSILKYTDFICKYWSNCSGNEADTSESLRFPYIPLFYLLRLW